MEDGTEEDDDQVMRRMMEASWKSLRRKGSASKPAVTPKATPSSAPASASSAPEANSVSEAATGAGEVPPAAQPAKKTGLGSWSRLLSRSSMPDEAKPSETPSASSDPVPLEASAEVVEADDEEMEVDIGTFLNSCWQKASRSTVTSKDASSDLTAVDVDAEGTPAAETASSELNVLDELAVGEDEVGVEDLDDADEADEGREVDENDLLGEEGEEVMQDEDAAEEDGREVGEDDVEPSEVPMPSDVVVIDLEDDDDEGNAAGAEFRQALDDLSDGTKLMEKKTVAKASAKAPSGPPPKHLLGGGNASGPKHLVRPSAISQQALVSATAGAAGAKQILVRTQSGHVGEPLRCPKGHHLKHNMQAGNACDECHKAGTAWRCVSGCDYDMCMQCYSKGVNRNPAWKGLGKGGCKGGAWPNSQGAKPQPAGSQIRTATPFKAGNQIRTATPLNANAGAKQGGLIPAWQGKGNNSIVPKGANVTQHGRTFSAPVQPSWGSKGNFPKAGGIVRTNSAPLGRNIVAPTGGPILPVGQAGNGIKRANSWQGGHQQQQKGGHQQQQTGMIDNRTAEQKRARTDTGEIAGVDAEGRRYNLNTIVVNFANVGASYAKKVLKREPGDKMLFDWEGVRRCVMYLTKKLGVKVVGVIFENFWATDNTNSPSQKSELPADIKRACESIEETPRIIGDNHKSADDEMTIKCAYHRNCRFMDNDNYRDWKQQLRDERCRAWLDKCQDLLHMRYYFDSSIGVFETLDGNVPPGLLAPNGSKIAMGATQNTKKMLWTAPNR